MYKLTLNNAFVVRLWDNAHIPTDVANRDYMEYLEWIALGNVPEPADPPAPLPIDWRSLNQTLRRRAVFTNRVKEQPQLIFELVSAIQGEDIADLITILTTLVNLGPPGQRPALINAINLILVNANVPPEFRLN
jgi:hypothetical protein